LSGRARGRFVLSGRGGSCGSAAGIRSWSPPDSWFSSKWPRDYNMGEMTRHFIPHSRPTIGVEEERAAVRVLRSGMIGGGEEVDSFERALERSVGGGRATAVHTGSAALHLALLGLGIGPGDRVVIPSYTCAAVLNAV